MQTLKTIQDSQFLVLMHYFEMGFILFAKFFLGAMNDEFTMR